MYQVEFNPVTIEMEMTLNEETTLRRWADICNYLFNRYAQKITKKEKSYIGHIKALASINDHASFKLSIYKTTIPAEIDINGDGSSSKLFLIVNSFVYGVNEEESLTALKSLTDKVEKEFLVKTTFTLKPVHHHDHDHGHDHDHE